MSITSAQAFTAICAIAAFANITNPDQYTQVPFLSSKNHGPVRISHHTYRYTAFYTNPGRITLPDCDEGKGCAITAYRYTEEVYAGPESPIVGNAVED